MGKDLFAFGAKIWPGLSKLVEECGEVVQVAGKLMGTRGAPDHWDGTNLRTRMAEELGDLLAAMRFVAAEVYIEMEVERRAIAKLEQFQTWHVGPDAKVVPPYPETDADVAKMADADLSSSESVKIPPGLEGCSFDDALLIGGVSRLCLMTDGLLYTTSNSTLVNVVCFLRPIAPQQQRVKSPEPTERGAASDSIEERWVLCVGDEIHVHEGAHWFDARVVDVPMAGGRVFTALLYGGGRPRLLSLDAEDTAWRRKPPEAGAQVEVGDLIGDGFAYRRDWRVRTVDAVEWIDGQWRVECDGQGYWSRDPVIRWRPLPRVETAAKDVEAAVKDVEAVLADARFAGGLSDEYYRSADDALTRVAERLARTMTPAGLHFNCSICHRPLMEPGGIRLTPEEPPRYRKEHICVDCWDTAVTVELGMLIGAPDKDDVVQVSGLTGPGCSVR